jgi:putative transposase
MEEMIRNDKVLYKNQIGNIESCLDVTNIEVSFPDGSTQLIHENDLIKVANTTGSMDLSAISEKNFEEAKKRYQIILPLLDAKRTEVMVKNAAHIAGVGQATLYRWIKKFEQHSVLTSLLPTKREGGRGKSRIESATDEIINKVIHSFYLTTESRKISKTYEEICRQCNNANIQKPSPSTVRNRIFNFTEQDRIKSRLGKRAHKERFEPKVGHFPTTTRPLEVVQIDHTKLDLMIINPQNGQTMGRPWLTLAMDIYSRMVVGFHLSMDDPSILGTGICIGNTILPKDNLMRDILGEDSSNVEWPCYGLMETIHVDNGKDFKSVSIERACMEYGINLEFRPVKMPEFGAHIERLLGTFLSDIHTIPGTTFNNISKRKYYDSSKKAILTFDDINKWLLLCITQVYHLKKHSQIGTSPLNLYREAILGTDEHLGVGEPKTVKNERKLYLDFLPRIERTIQSYGLVIDHIYYYSDVLKDYIHAVEKPYVNSSRQVKKKFVFRRDPRDLSKLFFLDPQTKIYYDIPYRDMTHPTINIWELRDTRKFLEERKVPIDERSIFNGLNQMREIESKAKKFKTGIRNKSKVDRNPKQNKAQPSSIDFNDLNILKSD